MGKQEQFNLVKEICIEYNTEIITLLKEKGFKYRIWEMKDFTPYQTEEELQEKFWISIVIIIVVIAVGSLISFLFS